MTIDIVLVKNRQLSMSSEDSSANVASNNESTPDPHMPNGKSEGGDVAESENGEDNIDSRIAEIETQLEGGDPGLLLYSGASALFILSGFAVLLFGDAILGDLASGEGATLGGGLAVLYGGVFALVGIYMTQRKRSNLQSKLGRLKAKKKVKEGSEVRGGEVSSAESYFSNLVEINVDNLSEYYSMVKSHTSNSFWISASTSVAGFFLIVTGLIVLIFSDSSVEISYISTGTGVVVEFISGVFFYLYNRTVRQLKDYHDSLIDVQNILLSFKIIEDTKDEDIKADMMSQMMSFLVGDAVSNQTKDENSA